MPRFIIEQVVTSNFLKNLVDNPRDRAQELLPNDAGGGLDPGGTLLRGR